jgi:hypothetical protein
MEAEVCTWLSPPDRVEPAGRVVGRNTPQKLVWWPRIVLSCREGAGVTALVRTLNKTEKTACGWRDRFLEASGDGGRMSSSGTALCLSVGLLGEALHHRTLRSDWLSKCMSLFCSEEIGNDDQFQE